MARLFTTGEPSPPKQVGGYAPPPVIPAPRGGEHHWPVPPDGIPADVRSDQPPMVQPTIPAAENLAPPVWRSWFS